MVTKKVKKIIRKKLYEYPIYDRLINELELEKDTTESRDINSSIRSKNKISRATEGQVIKNISIDGKINTNIETIWSDSGTASESGRIFLKYILEIGLAGKAEVIADLT